MVRAHLYKCPGSERGLHSAAASELSGGARNNRWRGPIRSMLRTDADLSEQRLLQLHRGQRQREVERRPMAQLTFSPNATTLALHEMLNDGEAQAGAALLARAG